MTSPTFGPLGAAGDVGATAPTSLTSAFRGYGVPMIILTALTLAVLRLGEESAQLQLSLLFGVLFGVCLQRSRFCFQCIWRDWLVDRDPRGLLAILLALAIGIAGYTLIYGAWLPSPAGPRLPPTAHIGPVGPVLVLAGLAFGTGMAVSGSCISAHLYRLGEGSPTAPFALLGAALGFGIGFLTWNDLYLVSVSTSPVLWFPHTLGYAGALAAGLAVLGLAAVPLLRRLSAIPRVEEPRDPFVTVFVRRWPAWVGGLAVGVLGVASYFRVGPLGVTAEIGSRARQAADALGALPSRLEGLDAFRGCATVVRDALLTPNGLFVGGLVLGSLAAAVRAGQFRPALPRPAQIARGLVGGTLMGWGAMTGLGCTVGTLLSGISAGAVSGWVFAVACAAGSAAVILVGQAIARRREPLAP